jgi:NADH-quinone oxidoreductase subunit E
MVNWEFFDDQTVQSARDLVDRLRAGDPPSPTRGAGPVCTFRETARVLAGFPDGRANEGPTAGPASLVGLQVARERADDSADRNRPSNGQSGASS